MSEKSRLCHRYSESERCLLRKAFAKCTRPNAATLEKLAERCNVTEVQVKRWFMNERIRTRWLEVPVKGRGLPPRRKLCSPEDEEVAIYRNVTSQQEELLNDTDKVELGLKVLEKAGFPDINTEFAREYLRETIAEIENYRSRMKNQFIESAGSTLSQQLTLNQLSMLEFAANKYADPSVSRISRIAQRVGTEPGLVFKYFANFIRGEK